MESKMINTDEVLEMLEEENPKACYPTDLKMARDKMSYEDAVEYLEFNTYDAFMGEKATPCFAELIKKD
jgi:hypothetical protein